MRRFALCLFVLAACERPRSVDEASAPAPTTTGEPAPADEDQTEPTQTTKQTPAKPHVPRVCAQGETRECLSFPESLRGIGRCVAGTSTCLADGSGFGACEGEVGPTNEQ